MKRIESILSNGKILFLAGIALLTGCSSLKQYIEPRVGLIVPVAAQEQPYKPSFLTGVAYGFNNDRFGLEAGLDNFRSSGEYVKTNSLLSRFTASYNLLEPTAMLRPHLMLGADFLRESSIIDIPEFDVYDEVKNTTFGLQFGIGATIRNRINTRLSYTMFPTSENVKGMVSLTAGYHIPIGRK
jgi:outer membrane protein assembly factor BamA